MGRLVKLGFIDGLPDDVSALLQQDPDVLTSDMSSIVAKARILTARRSSPANMSVSSASNTEIRKDGNAP